MTAPNIRMAFEQATGKLHMVVVPTYDWELRDPAFSPTGHVCVNLPMATYLAAGTPLALLQAAQPLVAAANPAVGTLLQAIITAETAAKL